MFSKGNESGNPSTGGSFKKFVGVSSVKVLAVNPTVEEWNKLTGGSATEERVYIGDKDGIKFAKVTFVVEVDSERTLDHSTGIFPITFWLRKQAIKGQNSGKIKIIDKYGQTAWATEEDIAAKKVPEYTNGPANIDADYRKCISGEEELTLFLKAYMNISNPRIFNKTTGLWETNSDLENCEARLEKVMKYFEGDFTEVKAILKLRPNNKVRVLFGVKKVEDKEYQDFLTTFFANNKNNNNVVFQKKLKEQTVLGRYANTYFGEKDTLGDVIITDAREYVVASTQYQDNNSAIPANTDPFDNIPAAAEPTSKTDNDLPF